MKTHSPSYLAILSYSFDFDTTILARTADHGNLPQAAASTTHVALRVDMHDSRSRAKPSCSSEEHSASGTTLCPWNSRSDKKQHRRAAGYPRRTSMPDVPPDSRICLRQSTYALTRLDHIYLSASGCEILHSVVLCPIWPNPPRWNPLLDPLRTVGDSISS
ncbi:hypothetical protein D9619_008433 [Psilocybe cf. subviscida]|uniref:Uncharacterized protein n=1 Tax=Psilocybe cf. subviscida TaxID=2480587 RepID=A0A8H5F0S9_9AGAR|nr:hypothetical protein D9619_008433 [Psilocybe cf. subviscida]